MPAQTQDEEQIIDKVAALEIGKAELECCVRIPAEGKSNKLLQEVSAYSTMSRSLAELANHPVDLRINRPDGDGGDERLLETGVLSPAT